LFNQQEAVIRQIIPTIMSKENRARLNGKKTLYNFRFASIAGRPAQDFFLLP
jgi:hypothetical protein